MGIYFDNPMGPARFDTVFRGPLESPRIQKKEGIEQASFTDLLKKISDSLKSPAAQPEQLQSVPDTRTALELYQRMQLQMNESLLQIVTNTEEENRFDTSLMDNFGEKLSLLSTLRQVASKNGLPQVQTREPIVEETKKRDTDTLDAHGIDRAVREAALTYGVDAQLIKSVIQAESGFKPDAVSSKGAMGLMQLMPETAKELGVSDPMNPEENIMGGTRYLKMLLDRYDGSVPLALAAYNWGMGNLDAHRRQMPEETKKYVAKITGSVLT